MNRVPFHVPVINYAQYLHPWKINDSGATNAISNLSLYMMSVVTNKLSEVFQIKSPITSEEICDKVRTQQMRFQTEPLQDEWFKNLLEQIDSSTSDCSTTQQSYCCKLSMIVDYNLHASNPHHASGLTVSGPKLDL